MIFFFKKKNLTEFLSNTDAKAATIANATAETDTKTNVETN